MRTGLIAIAIAIQNLSAGIEFSWDFVAFGLLLGLMLALDMIEFLHKW